VKIRAVAAADLDAIVALWRVVFPEYADPDRPQRNPVANIERKLAFGDGLFWLAEDERGRIAGTVMAGYDGHRGWIYSLGVAPAQRRRGIGRALMAFAEAQLRARGCPKINLQVLTANAASVAFYRALGYAPDPVESLGKRLA
jgi:hypothetical protein